MGSEAFYCYNIFFLSFVFSGTELYRVFLQKVISVDLIKKLSTPDSKDWRIS